MVKAPDIVYPVRKGEWNEELRYSLRSLSNLPHGRVWIVGHKPSWVRVKQTGQPGVRYWPRPQRSSKYRNANESLVEVATEIGNSLTSPFLLFNDDFYVMKPIEWVPTLHMGRLAEVIELYRKRHHTGAYWRGMVSTYRLLQEHGISDPLSYELHVPMPIWREPLLKAWEIGKSLEVLHIRTVMGNLMGLGGEQSQDVKAYGRREVEALLQGPFFSSNDMVPAVIRDRFKEPSPYEVAA
jgi:hypothetical protein